MLEPVAVGDFEDMLALRIEALRESLERLGRFDLARARERFASTYAPQHMHHVVLDSKRVGFITLLPCGGLQNGFSKIEHLYVQPGHQGAGLGAWALQWAKGQVVDNNGQGIVLSVLKLSDANRFYQRHEFVAVGHSDFDIDYKWVRLGGEAE
jgi:GNAT superfamily N-acetyltransferase